MKEFHWKENFINQENRTEHINKYELLLLMLKVKNKNTSTLEQNIESLKVQDFETYEDFYVKYVYPQSESSKEQSKFLHNQQFFSTLLSQLQPGKQLKCSRTEKNEIFYKFSKYVTLKDIKSKDKNYYRFACSLLLLLALLPIVYVIHALWPLFVLNALFTLIFFYVF